MDQTLRGFAPYLRALPAPELRKDPIVNRWVIVATERAQRPVASRNDPELDDSFCPFCSGQEAHTPPEVFAFRAPGTQANEPGWRVRVVPNRYPAVRPLADLPQHQAGLFTTRPGFGVHEVIIECPDHLLTAGELSAETYREVLLAYQERLTHHRRDPRLAYAQVFKNVGTLAGASLTHPHSQLIGMPVVPSAVEEELTGALAYYQTNSRCVFCDLLTQELDLGRRIVLETPGFVCLTPFAGRFPFEMWIVPKQHHSDFPDLASDDLIDLASVLRSTLRKLETALTHPAYNLVLHTGPFPTPALPHYHWHLEILPRLTRAAGFEWGTGLFINPVPPEQAAEFLRGTNGNER